MMYRTPSAWQLFCWVSHTCLHICILFCFGFRQSSFHPCSIGSSHVLDSLSVASRCHALCRCLVDVSICTGLSLPIMYRALSRSLPLQKLLDSVLGQKPQLYVQSPSPGPCSHLQSPRHMCLDHCLGQWCSKMRDCLIQCKHVTLLTSAILLPDILHPLHLRRRLRQLSGSAHNADVPLFRPLRQCEVRVMDRCMWSVAPNDKSTSRGLAYLRFCWEHLLIIIDKLQFKHSADAFNPKRLTISKVLLIVT